MYYIYFANVFYFFKYEHFFRFVELEVGIKRLEFKCMTECTEMFNLEMLKVSYFYYSYIVKILIVVFSANC